MQTDRQVDGFTALYSRLASVPALSHRLGAVAYNRAFSTLMYVLVLKCMKTAINKPQHS